MNISYKDDEDGYKDIYVEEQDDEEYKIIPKKKMKDKRKESFELQLGSDDDR